MASGNPSDNSAPSNSESADSTSFSDFPLAPAVLQAIGKVGYETPSPVQRESIAPLLEGSHLLATAQTGTGKTAAFALPLLSNLNLNTKAPQILVLAPTRELAIQVAEAFDTYASEMHGFKVLPIYGGQSMQTQLQQLKRGVHVVVGTPGRVMDHLRRKSLKLDQLQAVVLDEADEMLRMGFIDDVEWILEHTPEQKQVALFSATMPKPIRKITERYLRNPVEVNIKRDTKAISNIEQQYWPINRTRKIDALTRLIEAEPVDGVVVFVRTKSQTVEVSDKLILQGIIAAPINGDMNQQLRERTISKLKDGQINVLVATDVAARGIDVARVSHVFNYDMPFDSDVYTHRIGRTGRAGRSGKAILFVTQREKRLLRSLEKTTNSKITQIELPTPAQIRKLRIDDFKKSVLDIDTEQLPELFKSVAQELIESGNKPSEELLASLIYLAQENKPFYTSKKKQDDLEKNEQSENSSGRRERSGKKDRSERSSRKNRKSDVVFDDDGEKVAMETYKIHVGYQDEVSPGDIVGAIANEADISSKYIGRINIEDAYSTIDLPEGMPNDLLQHLKKVRVKSQPLEIERFDGSDHSPSPRKRRKPTRKDNERRPNKGRSNDDRRGSKSKPENAENKNRNKKRKSNKE